MEERIKDNLVQGEEILWSSRPAAFQPMDKTHKSYYIRRSIIVAVVSAVILAAYFYSAIATSAGIKWGVVAVLLAVALYSLVSPVLDINRLRKCSYVLTNENLFLVTPSDVRSVKLSRTSRAAQPSGNILCGGTKQDEKDFCGLCPRREGRHRRRRRGGSYPPPPL